MSNEEIVVSEGKPGKRSGGSGGAGGNGSISPSNGDFAKWLERQFRGDEQPQAIDAYPLYKGQHRDQRLYHYAVKVDEKIRTERAVELSNEIFSDCQLHCDSLPRASLSKEGSKTYEVSVVNDRNGGLAHPVATFNLKLMPRLHQPAPDPDEEMEDLSSEDGDALTARKMIIEVHRENTGRQERAQAGTLAVVGETMLLLKDSLKDSFVQNRELHGAILGMMTKQQEMINEIGRRSVEEKAVAIDAANAEVEREARRAAMAKENMWTNVQQGAMLEAIKVVGGLAPGFGQLLSAVISGKAIPPPPQLPASGTASGTAPPSTVPAVLNEKMLLDRFIEAAENTKHDETSTVAEKLFGKDDAAGKQIAPGVFTIEQVAILSGVHMGSLGIDALDALIPESGKPEAIQLVQSVKAMAYLTPDMSSDIAQVLNLRKAAKKM